MSEDDDKMETVVEVCKRRGIIYPSAEIYGSLAGFWDYGPVGNLIKRNIEDYWRECFIGPGTDSNCNSNIVEISGSTVLPEDVFEASGHIDSFVDPITQCKKCNSIHRADHLIEENSDKFVEGNTVDELTSMIKTLDIKCPSCGSELGDVRVFNLMLKTNVSPVGDQVAYLRPETAQNIFTSFRRVFISSRGKLPFGIAQLGHSFRNEISPRHFIMRLREFNQFEIEMFIDPENPDDCPNFDGVNDIEINFLSRESQEDDGKIEKITVSEALDNDIIPNKFLAYFIAKEMEFYKKLGIPDESIRHRHMLPDETPHYSKGNFDLEIKFDFGWKETVGNAYRGNYDLKKHSKHSGTKHTVSINGRKVIPEVVEPSFGLERTFLGVLLYCFREGKERGWNWFEFPPKIAPYTIAIFPLMKKDGLPEKAKDVFEAVEKMYDVFYDESGSIGKRYARMDEIGVPYCITIDHNTLEDDTVTLRNRDSTEQIRIKIDDLCSVIWKLIEGNAEFEKVGKPV